MVLKEEIEEMKGIMSKLLSLYKVVFWYYK